MKCPACGHEDVWENFDEESEEFTEGLNEDEDFVDEDFDELYCPDCHSRYCDCPL